MDSLKLLGIIPENELSCKYKSVNTGIYPNDSGRVPLRALKFKDIAEAVDRFPIELGIVPVNPIQDNCNSPIEIESKQDTPSQ